MLCRAVGCTNAVCSFRGSQVLGDLWFVRSQYIALLRAARLLQDHFGLVIACDVASIIFLVLYKVDAFLRVAMGNQQELLTSVSGQVFVIHSLLRIVVAVESCRAAVGRAEEIRSLLTEWSEEVPPLRFSAAGFFSVDRSLIVSMISVIITYGTVMYQLRSA
ncbi:uncharacterized protein LOC124595182 [Schistocerca americana]|uniref:uncharacterized protein LOC124595182 n=1 Tax=Schistocerca americana TaxID=7009 RepID=UPI001F501187|nr:uncharacterized protein LOC124595182 [Schistocerca americana]XP_046989752.1 uncharacterized protein LOC124595182 [Schistocerca americana]XP_046989753.1 uncharacterized protein LOC124595182 [Schistocerca americana]XP_046989754.1 uncharacterized protein LOC124595182 [Schistocerca americana]XP_046989755.1 uncharacterized protein LOC124595182 [Schistocerca americana]